MCIDCCFFDRVSIDLMIQVDDYSTFKVEEKNISDCSWQFLEIAEKL